MNDICEAQLWSLPWHALQRNLASGLETAVNRHGVAVSANSWLGRAARLAAAAPVLPAVPSANRMRPTR
jgi:hypothetical protein